MYSGVKNVFKNEYIYSILTKIFLLFIGLIHSAIYARYLGASLNGSINYITSITSIAAIIITGGIHQAYPYFRKKYGYKEYIDKYMSITTITFLILGLIALVMFFVVDNPEVSLMGVLTVTAGYSTITGYVLLVEEPNKRNNVFMIAHIIETLFVVFLYVFTSANLILAVIAYLIADVFKIICFLPRIKFRLSLRFTKEDILELYKYGFFPMIALLLTTLNYKIDVIMLKNSAYITLAQVGVYSIGCTIANKALLIPDSLKVILVSKLAKGKDASEVARVMRLSFAVCVFVAVSIVAVGCPFVQLLYGNEYKGAYAVICISIWGTIFMTFFKMIAQYNIMNKKQMLNAIMLSVSILINVCLNLILVPVLGINGAAIATAIGYLSCAIVFIIYFCKTTNITVNEVVFIQKEDVKVIKYIVTGRKN